MHKKSKQHLPIFIHTSSSNHELTNQVQFHWIITQPIAFADKVLKKHHELHTPFVLIRFETPCTKNNENSKDACTFAIIRNQTESKQIIFANKVVNCIDSFFKSMKLYNSGTQSKQ